MPQFSTFPALKSVPVECLRNLYVRNPQRSQSSMRDLEGLWRWKVTDRFAPRAFLPKVLYADQNDAPPPPVDTSWVHGAFLFFCKEQDDGRMGKKLPTGVNLAAWRYAYDRLGIPVSEQRQVDALFAKLDRNRDGQIDFNEFHRGLLPAKLPSITAHRMAEQRHTRILHQATMHPVPIEKDHANQAPFLNNLWKENPAWQSSKWKPMFRHDRGGCTFTNKRTLDLYHSINFQPPQGVTHVRHSGTVQALEAAELLSQNEGPPLS